MPTNGPVPVSAWPGLMVGAPLAGGHRNPVLAGRLHGAPVVVRHSGRSEASLQWEFNLLRHLHHNDVLVPEVIPTADGRPHLDGWHVQRRIEGRHLDGSPGNAAALHSALTALHGSTAGWPQRPGSRSARQLLTHDQGADVDLGAVPADPRRALRAAWAALDPHDTCVVHGDAGGTNALVLPDGRCALLDWDESRVDDPRFDVADPTDRRQTRAALAWEIATCWLAEPDYARSLVPQLMD